MVHYSKIINGISTYIDREIAPQLQGSMKGWLVGVAGGIISTRAGEMLTALAQHPLAQTMGLASGENIDEELLYHEMLKQAQKSPATLNIPLLGPVTFSADDVEKLHRYIMGG